VKEITARISTYMVMPWSRLILAGTSLIILIVIPALVHQQFITGTIVNAVILLTAVMVGPMEAIIIGLFPSLMALSYGLLPLALAPAIPYIMTANALFVYSFHLLRRYNLFGAAIAAALIKFLFLYGSTHLLLTPLLQEAVYKKVLVMMSWPQLLTALMGGLLAVTILKLRKGR
jgi:hypothetical protein